MQKITVADEAIVRKNNMKIFPWYKMLAWDLIFFYSIVFLFLVDVKGLTPAQVIITDAFYPLFKFILQPFGTIISNKLGKRKGIIFGNIMVCIYLVLLMLAQDFYGVAFATAFCSFGFVIKNLCETNFLYESVPHCKNRGEIFGKLDGRGFFLFYVFDGITSLLTGFTYVINPYYPIVISLILNLICVFLSTRLQEIPKSNLEKLKEKSTKTIFGTFAEFFRDFRYGFRYVLKSNRLRSLVMIYSVFYGILVLTLSLRRSLLNELEVSAEYFGIIFAVMGFIAAIFATASNWFNKTFKNKTLTVLTIPYCISCILLGIIVILGIDLKIAMPIILGLFALQYVIRGPFYTIIKRYFNNFSTTKARNRIYSITTFFESLVAAVITILGALVVEYMDSSYSFLIIGGISLVLIILILDYMKTRVGLKPEEYKRSEIEMLNLK